MKPIIFIQIDLTRLAVFEETQLKALLIDSPSVCTKYRDGEVYVRADVAASLLLPYIGAEF